MISWGDLSSIIFLIVLFSTMVYEKHAYYSCLLCFLFSINWTSIEYQKYVRGFDIHHMLFIMFWDLIISLTKWVRRICISQAARFTTGTRLYGKKTSAGLFCQFSRGQWKAYWEFYFRSNSCYIPIFAHKKKEKISAIIQYCYSSTVKPYLDLLKYFTKGYLWRKSPRWTFGS